jgi:hypothetical protein
MEDAEGVVVALALLGLGGGLLLLARGLAAYRAAHHVAGMGTSRIATLAAGEVRLVGTIEADVMTLVSPLQSVPCVYYRSRVREGSGEDAQTIFSDERATGFRVRDESGTIRVFPRGTRWDAPLRFDATSDWTGADPPGLRMRTGSAHRPAIEDRDAQVAALLSVRPAVGYPGAGPDGEPGPFSRMVASSRGGLGRSRSRDYEERRLEAGDLVTVVGSALPYSDLHDPAAAERYDPGLERDDPEVAMNLAEAREAGLLVSTPEEAWGNAAIPGFGIGRPTRAPELDPEADVPNLAHPEEAAATEDRFVIPAGELVMAASPGRALIVASGTPGEARAREDARVLVGLAGAALAIACAMVLAVTVQGALR